MSRLSFLAFLIIAIPANAVYASTCNFNQPGYVINRFVDNDDGTVQDSVTGLTWQKCIMGDIWNTELNTCVRDDIADVSHEWKAALSKIQDFNNDEFSNGRLYDWRLPNIKELSSIVSTTCSYPAIDDSVFHTEYFELWSSTPSATLVPNIQNNSGPTYVYENYIWGVNLQTGREFREPLSSKNAVRLVRGISE